MSHHRVTASSPARAHTGIVLPSPPAPPPQERDEAEQHAKREADGAARRATKAAADLEAATAAIAALTAERDDLKRRGGAMLALEKELETTRAAAEAGRVAAAELAAATVKVAELGKLYHDEQLLRKKVRVAAVGATV